MVASATFKAIRLRSAFFGRPILGPSWIMSEQPRTLSRDRITGIAGHVSQECLNATQVWLEDFLDL